jgi:2-keto-4-pentenoate hydratase
MVAHPRVVRALEAQLESWRSLLHGGATRVGWKLAYEIPEIDALTGGAPVVGHITSATVIEPGGVFDGATPTLRAETELAVEVGKGAVVAGLGVALELVDVARPPHEPEAIIAENVFHRAVVLGPRSPAARETSAIGVDPGAAVATVAALLEAVGEELLPGDVVLAGGLTHEPVAPGDVVEASIDGLGAVAVAIA